MIDSGTIFSAYTALVATGTFIIGYLLGERNERRRLNDAANDVREAARLVREFIDQKRSVSPDHRDV